MAVSYALHQGSHSTANQASYATATGTPTANATQVLGVAVHRSAGAVGTPTVSGCGLTWNQVAQVSYNSATYRVLVFTAVGASPTTGQVTIDLGGTTHDDCSWAWIELSGDDTSAPVVQSNTGTSASGAPNVSLSAFGSANNATLGWFGGRENLGTWTEGGGFTVITAPSAGGAGTRCLLQFRTDNDTGVDASYSSGGNVGGIALELKAEAGTSVTTPTIAATVLAAPSASYTQTATAAFATFAVPTPTVGLEGSQILRPIADITTTDWIVTPAGPTVYTALDETQADDTEFVTSPDAPAPDSPLELKLSEGATPPGSSTGTLRVRMRQEG